MLEKHRVLIVSGRLLVADSLASLLTSAPQIADVRVTEDLYEALVYSGEELPDVIVIDLPSGASYDIGRPISVRGKEIKTIVLQEGERNGQARLYLYLPGKPANLTNLMSDILWEGSGREEQVTGRLAAIMDAAPDEDAADPPQPTSFMSARESGPSRSRISNSSEAV